MSDPPNVTRERGHSLRGTTHRMTVTRPRPNWGSIEGRTLTDVVELRKLTRGNYRQFPLWISDFGGERVLQTSGLSEAVSVFGRFGAYQIVPIFTKSVQRRGCEGARRGS